MVRVGWNGRKRRAEDAGRILLVIRQHRKSRILVLLSDENLNK